MGKPAQAAKFPIRTGPAVVTTAQAASFWEEDCAEVWDAYKLVWYYTTICHLLLQIDARPSSRGFILCLHLGPAVHWSHVGDSGHQERRGVPGGVVVEPPLHTELVRFWRYGEFGVLGILMRFCGIRSHLWMCGITFVICKILRKSVQIWEEIQWRVWSSHSAQDPRMNWIYKSTLLCQISSQVDVWKCVQYDLQDLITDKYWEGWN